MGTAREALADEDAERAAERRRLEGHAALVLAQVVFGLFPLFVLLAVAAFTPRAIVAWRLAFGAAVLGGLALAVERRRGAPAARALPRYVLASLLGVVANQVLAVEGIARTTATQAGLLMTTIPVFTYAIAVLARQERFEARRAAGIAVALSGALVLLVGRAEGAAARASAPALGNALVVLNCLAYAAFLVLARPLLADRRPLAVVGWLYLLATPAVPLVARGQDLLPPAPPASAVLGVAYALVFPTVVGHFLATWALSRVSASTTAVFIYLQPLVAGLAGALVLGERPSATVGTAAALLFAGIGLVVRRAR